jgi:hypothetical protein
VKAIFNPAQVTEIGKKLYAERFEPLYAPEHTGEILAIEVQSKTAYLGNSGGEALRAAMAAHPEGFFHVLRIGGGGVYKVDGAMYDTHGWFL